MTSGDGASLAAALIVRDEEHFLPDCLASLEAVVDEVVVVDTGSRDRSCEIAERAGARLLHHEWAADFAAARNVGLDACQSDWILYIDADERVVGGDGPAFRSQLEDDMVVGLTVRFRPATGYTVYREPRVFRRHPEVRFRGVIHETHLPDLYRLAQRERKVVQHSELALDHLGYDGDVSHKHLRNLPLLRARVREDPDHIYSWWHLGQTLAALGRAEEAVDAWQEGLKVARKSPGAQAARYLPHLALLEYEGAEGERFDEELWQEAVRFAPGHPLLLWIRIKHRMRAGRWADAIVDLETLVATPFEEEVARQFAADERLFQAAAPEALATCLFRIGRFDRAEELYRQLAELVPGREFEVKRDLAAIRARRVSDGPPARGGEPGEGDGTGSE